MTHLVPVLFVLVAIIFTDPLMVLMPSALMSAVMVVFFVLFGVYAVSVWKEKAIDERDELHRASTGHTAYLTGAGIAVVGILYQAVFIHDVDMWLVGILVGMVIAKSYRRYYMLLQN